MLPKLLLNLVNNEARSTTGSNLRNIRLLTGKDRVEDLKESDITRYGYAPVESWKFSMVQELIDIREGKLEVEQFSKEELDEILEHLCTI